MKPNPADKDRRQDHARRLRVAVRRAHDRMFSVLRPEEKIPAPQPQPRR